MTLPKPGAVRGRPTLYTDEIGRLIAEELCDGKTLSEVCKDPRFPSARAVRRWSLDENHPFSPIYRTAREIGYHHMADEVIDIADRIAISQLDVNRARLQVDVRKWMLAKALPRLYGDKLAVVDPDGGKIVVEFVK